MEELLQPKEQNLQVAIERIHILDLFGRYDYELKKPLDLDPDLSKLIIFYGDNGTGKTTIIELIYHLLSLEEREGHKSLVSKILFHKVEIQFSNNIKVLAERPSDKISGNYTMSLYDGEQLIGKINFEVEDGSVKPYDREEEWDKIREYLDQYNLSVYFLTDNRSFLSDILLDREDIDDYETILRKKRITFQKRIREIEDIEKRTHLITNAIERAEKWLNKKVNQASDEAEISVNKIYSEIIKSIATTDRKEIDSEEVSKLFQSLEEISLKSNLYSKYRIISSLDFEEIYHVLEEHRNQIDLTIWRVLKPYIESIKAKLDALEEIYNLIKSFTEYLNKFYLDKSVEYDFYEGIRIRLNGKYLKPTDLSSGEKQLLMLFCNTISARDKPSIFIIDEPELSLNVKWQRQLIDSLLALTYESEIQFIFATHSLELLTQFKNNVLKLENKQVK